MMPSGRGLLLKLVQAMGEYFMYGEVIATNDTHK